MPPLFRLYSNPFNSSGLDVVVVMRPKVIDKTITRSIMQSDSYCFIQHYNQHDDTCTRQELIHQTRAVRDRIPPPRRICSVSAVRIRIRTPDLDSRSGLFPKCIGDFLVQGYICDKNFHENPTTFSGDISQTVEKCRISQCWRILFKMPEYPDPEADDFQHLINSSLFILHRYICGEIFVKVRLVVYT